MEVFPSDWKTEMLKLKSLSLMERAYFCAETQADNAVVATYGYEDTLPYQLKQQSMGVAIHEYGHALEEWNPEETGSSSRSGARAG